MFLKKSSFRMLALCTVLFTGMCATSVQADEFDTLRIKWQTRANGGSVNVVDADVSNQIAADTGNAQASWNTLVTSAGRTSLWPDQIPGCTVPG